jgi:hypothetical protein
MIVFCKFRNDETTKHPSLPGSLRFQSKWNDNSIENIPGFMKRQKTNKITKMFDIRVMCVNFGVVTLHALHSMLFGG